MSNQHQTNEPASAETRPPVAGDLDRHTVGPALREIIDAAAGRSDWTGHRVSIAGSPALVMSNSAGLLSNYLPRLFPPRGETHEGAATLVAWVNDSDFQHFPIWADISCHPRMFHAILAQHGLRAAYPYSEGVWQIFDDRSNFGVLLVRDLSALPAWDSGAPFRQHIHWLLQQSRQRLTHASTLGVDGKGVLFLGNSGAGKSGMCLAGVAHGLQTVGDDYVALSFGQEVTARPLYSIIKQDRFGLSCVAGLAERTAHLDENWKGKVELDPTLFFPDAFTASMRIDAVLLPKISGLAEPRLTAAPKGNAMRALMRSNLHQFPGEPENGMVDFGAMIRQLPVAEIELTPNFKNNAGAVRTFIKSL